MKFGGLLLLIVSTLRTVSVGIPICSSQRGEDLFCRCISDGISSSDSAAIRKRQPDNKDLFQSVVAREENIARDILNPRAKTLSGGQKLQRRSVSKRSTEPPLDDPSPRDKRLDPGYPTEAEMRLYLSEREMESYIKNWRAGKEYKITLYHIAKGHILTEEQREKIDSRRRSYNEAIALEHQVQEELVRTNRARPGLLRAYLKRVNANPIARSKERERKSQLKSLIDDNQASPEEVEEYQRLLAKPKQEYQAVRERKIRTKNRMEELESLIKKKVASDADLVEYKALKAKTEYQLQREREKGAKRRAREKDRIKELEKKIGDKVATDADRAEYDKIMASRRRRLERKIETRRERNIEEKARLEELEEKKRNKVATDAELAEYNGIIAKREKESERNKESHRRRYRAKKKKKAETGQSTPSIETKSEGASGQSSSANQPLQFSNDPLRANIKSFSNQLGRVLRTPRAQNWPWNLPPVPGAAPRLPFPFGTVP